MISKVQIPVAVFDHVLSGVHKNLATCQGTRTQRVGGVRTGPWQRRHPTWMGGDSHLLKHSTSQCCSTIQYSILFHCGRGAVSTTSGLAGRQSMSVMRATTHRMRKICLVNVQQRPRSFLTDAWQRRRCRCTPGGS